MSGQGGESEDEQSETDHKRITMLGNPDVVKEWDKKADELNMSRSEFIRSMVHAGQRQIAELDTQKNQEQRDLKEKVLAELPEDEVLEVDEIVQKVVGPIKTEITDEILPSLDENGEIRYNPKERGYEKQ